MNVQQLFLILRRNTLSIQSVKEIQACINSDLTLHALSSEGKIFLSRSLIDSLAQRLLKNCNLLRLRDICFQGSYTTCVDANMSRCFSYCSSSFAGHSILLNKATAKLLNLWTTETAILLRMSVCQEIQVMRNWSVPPNLYAKLQSPNL